MKPFPLVGKEGHIVDRRLNPQDQTEFVIQLDRGGTHAVLDAGSPLAYVEAAAHLAWVVPEQFPSEKGRNVRRLDRVDQGLE